VSILLELDGVSVSYDGARAIEDVSLVVPDGSVVALLGPNGAGKTTTLKAISGLTPLDAGRITFRGERVDGMAANRIARKGITHVPEGRGIFPALSVNENLTLATRAPGGVERMLDAFPVLGRRREQQAATLSGGEQQMLALARAFAGETPLLMVDELSLGLAPMLVDQLYLAIAELAAQGRAILLVEQYVERALGLAELVYVFAGGRVVFAGEPGEIAHAGGLVGSYLGR
jgi:branched-chain amino acid transport system ATP-binding protein